MNRVQIQQPPLPSYGYQYGPGVFNQQLASAQAESDPRQTMKEFDRRGMSRGRGQRSQADAKGAVALAEGVQQAYSQQATDAANISQRALDAAAQQEQYAQALAQIQAQQQARRMGILQGLL